MREMRTVVDMVVCRMDILELYLHIINRYLIFSPLPLVYELDCSETFPTIITFFFTLLGSLLVTRDYFSHGLDISSLSSFFPFQIGNLWRCLFAQGCNQHHDSFYEW